MNVENRLQKLENKASIETACECCRHYLSEMRDMTVDAPPQIFNDDPVFCEACGRKRRRIIVEIVDQAYLVEDERKNVINATFDIATRPPHTN